jgi:hypothetical protein
MARGQSTIGRPRSLSYLAQELGSPVALPEQQ